MPVARVNGIDLNYVVEGEGEPLVLVYNLIASLHAYDFNAPVFVKHFRTIRYDLRGHGRSSKPEGEAAYTFDALVNDLHGLLEHLNVERFHLVGQAIFEVSSARRPTRGTPAASSGRTARVRAASSFIRFNDRSFTNSGNQPLSREGCKRRRRAFGCAWQTVP